MSNYVELVDKNETEIKKFWKGIFQCYVNVAKKHKFLKKNIYKKYWLVLGRSNTIYLFKTPTHSFSTFYDCKEDIKYFFNKKNNILIWSEEKKVKYSIKFFNDIEFDKFKEIFNKRHYI